MFKCHIDLLLFSQKFSQKKDNCLGDIVKKNILICDNCLSRNYHINISNRNNRLKLKKYCPQCKKHILHEESR